MNYFESNLALMAEHDPRLAAACRTWEPLEDAELETAKTGEPVLQLPTPDGARIYLHSRYNPAVEASRLIDSYNVEPGDTVFVFGFAFGYHLLELARHQKPEAYIVVLEADRSRFRTALEKIDLSPLLERQKVIFIIGEPFMSVFERLQPELPKIFAGRIVLVAHPPSLRINPEYYESAKADFRKFTASSRVSIETAFALARIGLVNRFGNLVDYILAPPMSSYAGRFKGCTGFVVSAGPSLAKNIDKLRKVGDRAVVIAVSTAFKRLLAERIPVHFTVVLDYNVLSKRYFENLPSDIPVPLIADAKANPDAVGVYGGPKIFAPDHLFDVIVGRAEQYDKRFMIGATVAHTAFLFARYAGCDPIVFVGQDFSYSHGLSHLPGTAIFTQWLGELNRFNTYEMKEWDFIQRLDVERAIDINGNPVFSDRIMLSYISEFEVLFASTKARLLNATEGGVPMRGAENVTLAEVAEKHLGEPISSALFPAGKDGASEPEAVSETFAMCRKRLDDLSAQAKEVERICESILEKLKPARNRLEKGKNADSIIGEIVALQRGLAPYEELLGIVQNLILGDMYLREKNGRELAAAKLENLERAAAEAKQEMEYVFAMHAAVRFFQKLLENAVEDIDAAGGER
jgi:hypothetical protein